MLNDLLRDVQTQYLAGRISLDTLVQRCEALLGQSESVLSPETYQHAMNCIYLLEDINAVVLDESRSVSERERLSVESELQKLCLIATGN